MLPLSLLLLSLAAAADIPAALPLDAATLARLPQVQADFAAHGKSHSCTGVRLSDLAAAAGLPTGADVRGPALTLVIIAQAEDGYRAAFSLGEIDTKLGNSPAIVTGNCDGKALSPDDGPLRLVVPNEARAARSVRQLRKLLVVQLP